MARELAAQDSESPTNFARGIFFSGITQSTRTRPLKTMNKEQTSSGLRDAACSPLASRPRHRIEIRSTFFDGWKTVVTLYDSNDETAKAKSKEVFYYYRGCLESRIIYEENSVDHQLSRNSPA
jgi:hypothetical protein